MQVVCHWFSDRFLSGQVVLFAFIAVPNIPTVHGIADVGFACLSSFLSRNKDAVPLLWSMHVHGALFFLEVPGMSLWHLGMTWSLSS